MSRRSIACESASVPVLVKLLTGSMITADGWKTVVGAGTADLQRLLEESLKAQSEKLEVERALGGERLADENFTFASCLGQAAYLDVQPIEFGLQSVGVVLMSALIVAPAASFIMRRFRVQGIRLNDSGSFTGYLPRALWRGSGVQGYYPCQTGEPRGLSPSGGKPRASRMSFE